MTLCHWPCFTSQFINKLFPNKIAWRIAACQSDYTAIAVSRVGRVKTSVHLIMQKEPWNIFLKTRQILKGNLFSKTPVRDRSFITLRSSGLEEGNPQYITLLQRNLWIFKSVDWNFYSLPGHEISKDFSCKFSKKLLNFQIRLWKYVTFWKIHKESMKFHNREVNKNSNHRIWKFKDFVLTVRLVSA